MDFRFASWLTRLFYTLDDAVHSVELYPGLVWARNSAAKDSAAASKMPIITLKNRLVPFANSMPPTLGPMAVPIARGVVIHPFARP